MSHFNNMNTTTEQGLRRNPQVGAGQTYGESPASGPAPTTAGHHKHDILNKLDPRVDSTQDRRPMPPPQNVPAGTYGPHSNRIANILDPRVDSSNPQHQPGMMHSTAPGAGGAVGGAGNVPEGTYGPHRSRMANAMDPRVDSDMDRGPGQQGGYPNTGYQTGGGGGVGYGTGAGAGMTGQQGYGYRTQETTHGGMGATTGTHHGRGQSGVGMMGGGATGAGMGGGLHNQSAAMSGPGPAPNTAGPHRSDLMNKLDPRVDSKTGMMKTTERRGI